MKIKRALMAAIMSLMLAFTMMPMMGAFVYADDTSPSASAADHKDGSWTELDDGMIQTNGTESVRNTAKEAVNEGQLCAVFDSADGSLTFRREAGTYTDGQTVGTLTYYTGFEDKEYSFNMWPPWYDHAISIRKVDFQATVAPGSCAFWFYGCENLEEVQGAGRLNTSGVKSMDSMFSDCSSLASLDPSGWDTSGVTTMEGMFAGCSSLASLNLSGWVTSEVMNMRSMFLECSSLAALDVSKWDTSSVTDMEYMFFHCSEFASLDVSGWKTSSVTTMKSMFDGCSELASLDVSKWDTSSVTDMSSMFSGCSKLASLNVSKWGTSGVTNMNGMFSGCSKLASLNASEWDTAKVKDMAGMFSGCSSLASLDISGWDTPSVTFTVSMFSGCSELAFLDLSGWDTSGATIMNGMFDSCSSLSRVKLGGGFSFKNDIANPGWRAVLPDAPADPAYTGKWVNSSMTGASGVTAAELRDNYPDTGNPSFAPGTYVWEHTPRIAVFDSSDGSLTFIYDENAHADGQVEGTKTYYTGVEDTVYKSDMLPSWLAHAADIKKVIFRTTVAPKSCACWFSGCSNLTEVQGADRLDTAAAASMYHMFTGCSSLSSLDVSGWDTSGAADMGGMFDGCTSLSSVKLGGAFSFKGAGDLVSPSDRAVLPDAPADLGHGGRWINGSEPGASAVAPADLRDRYPEADNPSYAPGAYTWDVHKMTHYDAVAPTCTKDGNIEYYACGKCNRNFRDAQGINELGNIVVAKTGHKYGAWTKLDAKQHMRVCAHDKTHVEKAAHSWNEGKVTKPATTTAVGVKTFTCKVCGATKNEDIPKLAKKVNPLKVKGKTATVRYSKLKKKAQSISRAKAIAVTGSQGKLTYKKVSVAYTKAKSVKMSKRALKEYRKQAAKKITINAGTGKVTVKKGLREGTYKVKVKVRAAGNANYNPSAWKTATVKIIIK